MVAVALASLAGICALLGGPVLPPGEVLACGIAPGLVVAFLSRRWWVLALLAAFVLCWWETGRRLDDRLDPALEARTVEISGVVDSVPQAVPQGIRFRLATAPAAGIPSRIELTWYEPAFMPRPAERLSLEARLRRPRGFANPGGSDYAGRMLREGIGATGYVRSATSEGRTRVDAWRRPVLVARGRAHDAIRAALGERPATGIVAGLSVGLQDALSPEQWRALARSGTSHLMAISGMHIGMLAALAAWLGAAVQRLRLRHGATGTTRDAALAAGTSTAIAYSALAGWSVPTERTAIMIVVVAAALRLRRRIDPAAVLALGALAVLVLDPLAPLAPGFWLSFVAVASIVFVVRGELVTRGLLRGFVVTQLAVTIGLVPVLIGTFGAVSLVSGPVNALAIPLYTLLIVPAVLLATGLAMIVPDLGTPALAAVAWFIELTWPVIGIPASWPLAAWGIAGLPWGGWLALTLGAAAALAPLPAQARVAGLVIVVSLCAWRAVPPQHGALNLAVLDVGQGLAAVVETRHHVLVYDTGPSFRSGADAGALAVEPYLRHRGIRGIDLLVASHDDDDHVGGAATLARTLRVKRRAASGQALHPLGRVERCLRGEHWDWDGVRFEWLHPGVDVLPGDNDRSCVLRIRAGPHVFLLGGDVERAAEEELLRAAPPGAVDVLVVPHHGSRSSSSPGLVAATRPQWAVVSAGHRNRWGFPAREVVDRWADAGAAVIETSRSGAIEFDVDPEQALRAPREWRRFHRRLWQDP